MDDLTLEVWRNMKNTAINVSKSKISLNVLFIQTMDDMVHTIRWAMAPIGVKNIVKKWKKFAKNQKKNEKDRLIYGEYSVNFFIF